MLRLLPLLLIALGSHAAAAVVVTRSGEVYQGDIQWSKGAWQLAGQTVPLAAVQELRMDPGAVALATVNRVHLGDGTVLTGEIAARSGMDEIIVTRSDGEVSFPGGEVAAITLGVLDAGATTATPPDAPYVMLREGRVVAGEIEYMTAFQVGVGSAAGRLRLDRDTIYRVVLRQGAAGPTGPVVRSNLGDVIPGSITAVQGEDLVITRTNGTQLQLGLASLVSVSGGGRDLSSEQPSSVSTQAFFSDVHAPVFGRGLFGEGTCAGLPCDQVIGVNSRTELQYRVDGGTLVVTLGLDRTRTDRGHAEFVVLMDGREVARVACSGSDEASSIAVPLSSGTLSLVFDYGKHGSAGDHGMWAWPVVVR